MAIHAAFSPCTVEVEYDGNAEWVYYLIPLSLRDATGRC
jgi:hypothetical protein